MLLGIEIKLNLVFSVRYKYIYINVKFFGRINDKIHGNETKYVNRI